MKGKGRLLAFTNATGIWLPDCEGIKGKLGGDYSPTEPYCPIAQYWRSELA
jgi:hypothetical protein